MDQELKKVLEKTAGAIRQLSIEAVQKANSGHPGLPLGCADFGAYLYGKVLRHNPKNPEWVNRDRFVLSAGHGSIFLYSCLHLAGFDLSLDEIKRFRQLHSKTPGHPEFHETPGVESTTGPLGQGIGNAVGQALGLKILQDKFGKELFDAKVYCLAGDGCFMEGVSSEASSFAGHLNLNNLVLFHDDNKITLDGTLDQSSSENVLERYKAYGFDVYEIDGNSLEDLDKFFAEIKEDQKRPIYVKMHTIIGKGSPHKAGTNKAHGSPLGEEEVALTKKALGLPEEEFYIPQVVQSYFEDRCGKGGAIEAKWKDEFKRWQMANPELSVDFERMFDREIPDDLEDKLARVEIPSPIAGRAASQAVLQELGDAFPFIYGGSADLSGSDCTMMKQFPIINTGDFKGRNIKYGIREFGMATIAAGLFQTHMFFPYIGTFLTFSDYMRNAIRLACLSKYHVIYQFTHDSILLGEDGPTHQPVEHYATLRAMPNLNVFRPADANEVKGSWIAALKYQGPSAIILTRQKLPELDGAKVSFKDGVGRGAYIVKKETRKPEYTLFATGSEVSLALDVAAALERCDKSVRVISMPCWEIFEEQDDAYKNSVVGGDLGKRVSIEVGVSQGWHKWVGPEGITICMEGFGASAPQADLANEFGFTTDSIMDRIL